MNQKKINICKAIFFFNFLIIAFVSITYKEAIQENDYRIGIMVLVALGIVVPLTIAMRESKCPKCKGYLSYKRNWIGKYCVMEDGR